MSDDLVAFIEARLAEDESVALAASGSTPRLQKAGFSAHWHTEPWYDGTGEHCVLRAGVAGDLTAPGGIEVQAGEHAARHDPSRVLRDVETSRWVLQQHAHYRFSTLAAGHNEADVIECPPAFPGTDRPYVGCVVCDYDPRYEVVDPHRWCGYVRRLASAWRDHPGFRSEWLIEENSTDD